MYSEVLRPSNSSKTALWWSCKKDYHYRTQNIHCICTFNQLTISLGWQPDQRVMKYSKNHFQHHTFWSSSSFTSQLPIHSLSNDNCVTPFTCKVWVKSSQYLSLSSWQHCHSSAWFANKSSTERSRVDVGQCLPSSLRDLYSLHLIYKETDFCNRFLPCSKK